MQELNILPLAEPISPIGWAIRFMAVGDMHRGKEIGWPRIVVFISTFDTSLMHRARILYLKPEVRKLCHIKVQHR